MAHAVAAPTIPPPQTKTAGACAVADPTADAAISLNTNLDYYFFVIDTGRLVIYRDNTLG